MTLGDEEYAVTFKRTAVTGQVMLAYCADVAAEICELTNQLAAVEVNALDPV